MSAISAAAEVQRRLWGTDPRAWADLAEAHNQPLFEAVLDAAAVGPGTRLLDVGCGSGLTLVLAAGRGAIPSGLDVSPGLLGIARERLHSAGLPGADLRDGDMESLPFADAAFDAVTGVNAFQFAGDPHRALRRGGPGPAPRRQARSQPVRRAGTVRGHGGPRGHERSHSSPNGPAITPPTPYPPRGTWSRPWYRRV